MSSRCRHRSGPLAGELGEPVAARLIMRKLVPRRAPGRQQHDVARLGALNDRVHRGVNACRTSVRALARGGRDGGARRRRWCRDPAISAARDGDRASRSTPLSYPPAIRWHRAGPDRAAPRGVWRRARWTWSRRRTARRPTSCTSCRRWGSPVYARMARRAAGVVELHTRDELARRRARRRGRGRHSTRCARPGAPRRSSPPSTMIRSNARAGSPTRPRRPPRSPASIGGVAGGSARGGSTRLHAR